MRRSFDVLIDAAVVTVLCAMLFLVAHANGAQGQARKYNARVAVQVPGAFVAASLNTGNDQTFGAVPDGAVTTFDESGAIGVPAVLSSWVRIPTAFAQFKPGYSVNASAYTNVPGDSVCVILPGTPFEVKWHGTMHCEAAPGYSHFDDADVSVGGGPYQHFTNATRNATVPDHGGTVTIFGADTAGLTTVRVDLPNGQSYLGPGVRF